MGKDKQEFEYCLGKVEECILAWGDRQIDKHWDIEKEQTRMIYILNTLKFFKNILIIRISDYLSNIVITKSEWVIISLTFMIINDWTSDYLFRT